MILNFFKLDLKLMKGLIKFYMYLPILFLLFAYKTDNLSIVIGYLFFAFTLISSIPFSAEENQQCKKMYYSFPASIKTMVVGRYSVLISMFAMTWILIIGVLLYLNYTNLFTNNILLVSIIASIFSFLVCIIQYPLYYKFGLSKGNILSTLIYVIPAIITFSIPNIFINFNIQSLPSIKILILGVSIILIIFAYISFKISCRICSKMEL